MADACKHLSRCLTVLLLPLEPGVDSLKSLSIRSAGGRQLQAATRIPATPAIRALGHAYMPVSCPSGGIPLLVAEPVGHGLCRLRGLWLHPNPRLRTWLSGMSTVPLNMGSDSGEPEPTASSAASQSPTAERACASGTSTPGSPAQHKHICVRGGCVAESNTCGSNVAHALLVWLALQHRAGSTQLHAPPLQRCGTHT